MPRNKETSLQFYKHCPNCQSELQTTDHHAECSNCDFAYYLNPAPCVTVVIENEDQSKILLGKRGQPPQQGMWDAIGGFIDPDETPTEAVKREVKEETGADLTNIRQLGEPIPDWYDYVPTLCFLYLAQAKSDTMQAQDDVAEIKWFDPAQVPPLAFKNIEIALERYLQLREESE